MAMKLHGTLAPAPGLLQLGQTSRTSEDPGSPGLSWAVHYLLGTQGLHSLASPSLSSCPSFQSLQNSSHITSYSYLNQEIEKRPCWVRD